MLVENQINVLSDEELEHDSREVLKEDKGKIDRDRTISSSDCSCVAVTTVCRTPKINWISTSQSGLKILDIKV